MVPLYALTVIRIFASRETTAGTAMYLLQWVLKLLFHTLTALNPTDYA